MLAIVTIPWEDRGAASVHDAALHGVYHLIGRGDPDLATRLHDQTGSKPFSACYDGRALRIGSLSDTVTRALMGGSPEAMLSGATTPQRLLDAAPDAPQVRIRLLTPTRWRICRTADLLPSPARLFDPLVRRWRDAGGPVVPPLDYAQSMVCKLCVQSAFVQERGAARAYGLTGTIWYAVPEVQARWYHALAAFAEYAGVGSHTTQGWGRVAHDRS